MGFKNINEFIEYLEASSKSDHNKAINFSKNGDEDMYNHFNGCANTYHNIAKMLRDNKHLFKETSVNEDFEYNDTLTENIK